MTAADEDAVIELAWSDDAPFEAIAEQFGLQESQVIGLMRARLKASSFRLWRRRVSGRKTKHLTQQKQSARMLHEAHRLIQEREADAVETTEVIDAPCEGFEV